MKYINISISFYNLSLYQAFIFPYTRLVLFSPSYLYFPFNEYQPSVLFPCPFLLPFIYLCISYFLPFNSFFCFPFVAHSVLLYSFLLFCRFSPSWHPSLSLCISFTNSHFLFFISPFFRYSTSSALQFSSPSPVPLSIFHRLFPRSFLLLLSFLQMSFTILQPFLAYFIFLIFLSLFHYFVPSFSSSPSALYPPTCPCSFPPSPLFRHSSIPSFLPSPLPPAPPLLRTSPPT